MDWPSTQMGEAGVWARLALSAPEGLGEEYLLQGDSCGCPPPSAGDLSGGNPWETSVREPSPRPGGGGWGEEEGLCPVLG